MVFLKSLESLFVNFWVDYSFSIICSVFLLFAGYFVLKILKRLFLKVFVNFKIDDRFILNLVKKLLQVGVWTFVGVLILQSFKVPVSKITVSLAPLFLVIGLGFKNFIANFVKSVQLKLLNPYNVGDVVEVDGIKGRVVRVDFLYTYLNTQEGGFTIISNSQIVDKRISNYNRTKSLIENFDFESYKKSAVNRLTNSSHKITDRGVRDNRIKKRKSRQNEHKERIISNKENMSGSDVNINNKNYKSKFDTERKD